MIMNNKNEIRYTFDCRSNDEYNDTISFFYVDDENNTEFRFEFDIDEKRDERMIEYVENYDWEYTTDELIKMKQADWSNVPSYDDSYINSITELIDEYLIFNESEVK